MFETAAIRNTTSTASRRVNLDRYVWFGNFQKERRKPKSISDFLASDKPFDANALDAYSESWAFSFYLIETRPRQYVQYLTKIARRDPLKDYPAAERLADFQSVFGKDLGLLESQFLRYVSGLKK